MIRRISCKCDIECLCCIGYEYNLSLPLESESSFIDYPSVDDSGSSTVTVDITDGEWSNESWDASTVCMQSAVAYGILGTSDGESDPRTSDVESDPRTSNTSDEDCNVC